jgi:hypothetical protein
LTSFRSRVFFGVRECTLHVIPRITLQRAIEHGKAKRKETALSYQRDRKEDKVFTKAAFKHVLGQEVTRRLKLSSKGWRTIAWREQQNSREEGQRSSSHLTWLHIS